MLEIDELQALLWRELVAACGAKGAQEFSLLVEFHRLVSAGSACSRVVITLNRNWRVTHWVEFATVDGALYRFRNDSLLWARRQLGIPEIPEYDPIAMGA